MLTRPRSETVRSDMSKDLMDMDTFPSEAGRGSATLRWQVVAVVT